MDSKAGRFVVLVCVLGLGLGDGRVRAATTLNLSVAAGNWNDANSWDTLTVPTSDDTAQVHNNGKVTISTVASAKDFHIAWPDAVGGKADIVDGAELTVGSVFNVGITAPSSVLQTGGAVTAGTLNVWSYGSYTQQAGRVRVTGTLWVNSFGVSGKTADYVLVTGMLEPATLAVGQSAGAGRFFQYGGMVSNTVTTIVGQSSAGSYYQWGGTNYGATLTVNEAAPAACYIITNGELRMTTAIKVARTGSFQGEVQVSGAANVVSPNIYIGAGETAGNCTGLWTQAGGTVNASSLMYLAAGANSKAIYTMSEGTLSTPNLAFCGTATSEALFTQTGGMLTPAAFSLPIAGSANATMLTQGGTNATSGNANVGYGSDGVGRWTIEGGTVSVGGGIYLGSLERANGQVNLSGGTLTANTITVGYWWNAAGTFTQSGGTNTVNGQLLIGNAATSSLYRISGGRLSAATLQLGSATYGTGTLHVAGMAPQVQATTYTQNPYGSLALTLEQNGGMRPIAVDGTATLGGALTIGRTNNALFEPGMVVTVMTYSARSGAFAQTNFLNDMTCRVNYGSGAITLDQLQPVLIRGTYVTIR